MPMATPILKLRCKSDGCFNFENYEIKTKTQNIFKKTKIVRPGARKFNDEIPLNECLFPFHVMS